MGGEYELVKCRDEHDVAGAGGNVGYDPASGDAKAAAAAAIPRSGSRCGGAGDGGGGNRSTGRDFLLPLHSCKPPSPTQRLASLDVFRGFTVVLMIMVDDVGGFIPALNHSPWDGVTLADFVMPSFLFIVGVALALTYKKVHHKGEATRKVLLRTLKLFLLGLLLQGGYFHGIRSQTFGVDMDTIRLMGIMQRISIAYIVAAISEIWLRNDNHEVHSGYSLVRRYRLQLVVSSILAFMYLALIYGLYVPDWEYTSPGENSVAFSIKCGTRGDLGPACNAAGMLDRKILGIKHLYTRPAYQRTQQCSLNSPWKGPLPQDAPSWCQAPFDPEGLISSVMAVVTCLIGLQFGHVIVHFKGHGERIFYWTVPSLGLLALSFALDVFLGVPMNKSLYSLSYMFATAGTAGLLFVGIYLLVDMCGYRGNWATMAIEWMGVHALMIYVLVACNIFPLFIQGFYWRHPRNNLLKAVGIH